MQSLLIPVLSIHSPMMMKERIGSLILWRIHFALDHCISVVGYASFRQTKACASRFRCASRAASSSLSPVIEKQLRIRLVSVGNVQLRVVIVLFNQTIWTNVQHKGPCQWIYGCILALPFKLLSSLRFQQFWNILKSF
jgi:hypothetical protein